MMKSTLLAVIAAATLAVPAWARQAAPASAATPAATGYSVDTPIETLAADPAAKAVLDKDLPDLIRHPAYDSFKSMSLKDLQPLSGGAITDEALAKTDKDLKALPAPKK